MELARLSYNRAALKRSMRLAAIRKGTTGQVEDLHAAATCVVEYIPNMKEANCKLKAFLHYTTCIVCPPEDNVLARLTGRMETALQRRPNKINAHHLYLRDVVATALKDITDPAERLATSKAIFARHHFEFNAMPQQVQLLYKSLVAQARTESTQEKTNAIAMHRAALELYVARQEQERLDTNRPMTSNSFIWNAERHARAEHRWITGGFLLGKRIAEKNVALTTRVKMCDQNLRDQMTTCRKLLGSPEPLPEVDDWVREVCRRPYAFRGSLLIFQYHGDACEKFFAPLVIFKAPHEMVLHVLERHARGLQGAVSFVSSLTSSSASCDCVWEWCAQQQKNCARVNM